MYNLYLGKANDMPGHKCLDINLMADCLETAAIDISLLPLL